MLNEALMFTTRPRLRQLRFVLLFFLLAMYYLPAQLAFWVGRKYGGFQQFISPLCISLPTSGLPFRGRLPEFWHEIGSWHSPMAWHSMGRRWKVQRSKKKKNLGYLWASFFFSAL
ncbi:uncharacterized protein P884DRAFT_254018, partial [Thermothelomyces heterothallicus CBS 202.75]|uniref:uncharacterized protein n=1 Tax=Thermothelomyces heterothallicus CBS 202.75 TaxID=1149848 RepID=UPI00374371BD